MHIFSNILFFLLLRVNNPERLQSAKKQKKNIQNNPKPKQAIIQKQPKIQKSREGIKLDIIKIPKYGRRVIMSL